MLAPRRPCWRQLIRMTSIRSRRRCTRRPQAPGWQASAPAPAGRRQTESAGRHPRSRCGPPPLPSSCTQQRVGAGRNVGRAVGWAGSCGCTGGRPGQPQRCLHEQAATREAGATHPSCRSCLRRRCSGGAPVGCKELAEGVLPPHAHHLLPRMRAAQLERDPALIRSCRRLRQRRPSRHPRRSLPLLAACRRPRAWAALLAAVASEVQIAAPRAPRLLRLLLPLPGSGGCSACCCGSS